MTKNILFLLGVYSIFVATAFSFNFKELFQTLEQPFIKENIQEHSLSYKAPQTSFVQKQQDQNANFIENKMDLTKKMHVEAKQDKIQRIMGTIDGLKEVKASCEQLIQEGSTKMETDYKQCISTVQNFNCSYNNEWQFLKEKHSNNITLMEEEIKAKEKAIEVIKEQVQKKSEGKSALIKEIIPEISKIEKDIGQVELIIELVQEIQSKQDHPEPEKAQPLAPTPAPAPQVLIKHEKKTNPIQQPIKKVASEEQESKKNEKVQEEKINNEEMEDFSRAHEALQSGIQERVEATDKEIQSVQPSVKAIQFQKEQKSVEKKVQNSQEQDDPEKSVSEQLTDFSTLENDEAVETIDEQFDQDNS